MKSKARRTIDNWLKQAKKDRQPVYIFEGQAFLFAAHTTDLDHYVVVWGPNGQFLCSCRGWWYSEEDECRHVKALKAQIEEGNVG